MVGWSQHNGLGHNKLFQDGMIYFGRTPIQKEILMNHMNGWADGWMGGGMVLWTPIGVLVVILLVVLIIKVSKK
jgi:hypothetical protein